MNRHHWKRIATCPRNNDVQFKEKWVHYSTSIGNNFLSSCPIFFFPCRNKLNLGLQKEMNRRNLSRNTISLQNGHITRYNFPLIIDQLIEMHGIKIRVTYLWGPTSSKFEYEKEFIHIAPSICPFPIV